MPYPSRCDTGAKQKPQRSEKGAISLMLLNRYSFCS
ncbi:unnamed protein product [Haemonchus placei]|uniref:Spermidine/putrescine ABC transporter ATP-binding protein n=1 Tax=Haemonchus placei TaxID=6290 RepID=A0A0N4X0K0_HAEPC|nr:unnamed protein product [Haemonchus placei]